MGPDTIAQKLEIIRGACAGISRGDIDDARKTFRENYPKGTLKGRPLTASGPRSSTRAGGSLSKKACLAVFERDGFLDRYTGQPMIYPGALLLVSKLCPNEFPYHTNWKEIDCHSAFWDFYPTIDHIDPSGGDGLANLLSTSMNNNMAKGNRSGASVGWRIFEPGDLAVWDGLEGWFIKTVGDLLDLLRDSAIGAWYTAATTRTLELDESDFAP